MYINISFLVADISFVDIVEKPSNFRLSLIGILSVYIFMVHKRAIGILIVGFLVIILMKIMKKLDWKRFAFLFSSL